MNRFLIYTNAYKDKDLTVANRIKEYLDKKGATTSIKVLSDNPMDVSAEYRSLPKKVDQNFDCMLVLGGDGTILEASREVRGSNIPLIGVNLGTLGFMTEIEPDSLEESLDALMADKFVIESRMMLNGRLKFEEGFSDEGIALNDIVITRSGSLQINHFELIVNGRHIHTYSADGMIITTPTGSTGYSLSAGGPIISPNAELIMLTPICAHSLAGRSIVFSADDVIEIKIPADRGNVELEVSFDGADRHKISAGDVIRVTKSAKHINMIKINTVSFLDTLRKKMNEV